MTTSGADAGTLTLRLLATSDLHTQIMPWDYLADQPAPGRGLARIATLIARARAEVATCLLLDNGDFIQGSPLGDLVAATGGDRLHPMIAAMNALRYDAATLGNHEFSHGLPFLNRVLRDADFPVVSANILTEPARQPFVPPFAILTRQVQIDGQTQTLRVGIVGFAPPQLVKWDHQHVAGHITTQDILAAATRVLPQVRAAGADLVVVLCHSGIGDGIAHPEMENAGAALAALPGVDVVVAGHTHQTFPPADIFGDPRFDTVGNPLGNSVGVPVGNLRFDPVGNPLCDPPGKPLGKPVGKPLGNPLGADMPPATLAGKPAVMPGFFGSHLGVIDLNLARDAAGWRILHHAATLWPIAQRTAGGRVTALVGSDPLIEAIAAPAHAATLAWARQRIGHNAVPLHSYFALIRDCPSVRVVAAAQTAHVARAMAGSIRAGLPILSAVAPFRAGGRGGPENYSHVDVGDLAMRHIADLYMHPNTLTAVQISGAELAGWLEHSASIYLQVQPGLPDQPLIDPDFPSFNFDCICGVTYRIDLSQPPRHDLLGGLRNPDARRIIDLRHMGTPVQPGAQFVLATNSYRTGGSGGFAGASPDRVIYASSRLNADILRDHIVEQGGIPAPGPANWGFVAMPGTSVLFDSAREAALFTDDLPPGVIEPLGVMPDGFLRFRLHL